MMAATIPVTSRMRAMASDVIRALSVKNTAFIRFMRKGGPKSIGPPVLECGDGCRYRLRWGCHPDCEPPMDAGKRRWKAPGSRFVFSDSRGRKLAIRLQ